MLLFTALDLASITSHIHNWVLFLLWLRLLILSGVISPLISSSILGTYRPGEFIFQCPIISPFHTVHGGSQGKNTETVSYVLLQCTSFCQLSYWLWQKTETKVHRATVWRSLNSAGTTQIWKKLCQQPGHMVSWVNLWLAGIETIEFPFNIYRTENSLPSKFYIVFLNPFLLFSLILRRKKKSCFSQESHFGYKNLYLFQLLLIINLECVLGLRYLFPTSKGRQWPGSCQEHQQKGTHSQNMSERTQEAQPPAGSSFRV